MSNKRMAEKLVDSDEVGFGGTLSEVHTISCKFHEFRKLPNERGVSEVSRPLRCHGHEWRIALFPRGHYASNEEIEHMSIFFSPFSDVGTGVRVKYCIRVGRLILHGNRSFKHNEKTGFCNAAPRAAVLDETYGYLDSDGALLVKIDMQVYQTKVPHWRPPKKLQLDMLHLLDSGRNTDALFSLRGTKFKAHSHILEIRAPILASMVEDAAGKEVDISDVDPSVFRTLLRYSYSDELPPASDIERDARALLRAADCYGCTGLKLHVEAEVVDSLINTRNAAEWVLFADAHSCPLLKEAATELYASQPQAVMDSPGWTGVKESAAIMEELTRALVGRISRSPGNSKEENDAHKMSVSKLRENLDEKGLDVDGTKEMLVERMENAGSDIND